MKTRTTIMIDGTEYALSDEFLSQILETAVEGACSHWADVSAQSSGDGAGADGARDFDVSDYADEEADTDDDDVFYTEASFLVSKAPAQGGTLDLQGVADAIERIATGEVDVPPVVREIILSAVQDGDASDIDAEAADCIVQIGLFDEIVYG